MFKLELFSAEKIAIEKTIRKQNTLAMQILLRYEVQQPELTWKATLEWLMCINQYHSPSRDSVVPEVAQHPPNIRLEQ